MEFLAVGFFLYFIIGSVIAAFALGRSIIDTMLDVVLWPVIVYYFLRYGRKL